MTVKATLPVEAWGRSLALRIPLRVARAARLVVGQRVTIEVAEGALIVYPTGTPKLTLEQKLRVFEPAVHGGEAMANRQLGAEVF
jgi:antitoxin MazE